MRSLSAASNLCYRLFYLTKVDIKRNVNLFQLLCLNIFKKNVQNVGVINLHLSNHLNQYSK